MNRLTSLSREVVALRNCPAVHALLLDVWQVAQEKGEAEGLLWAENVRAGVLRYVEHERTVASYGAFPKAGAE